MFRSLLALITLAAVGTAGFAAESPVTAITAYPPKLALRGTDDAPQLVITGTRADGRLIDLSGAATYSVSDAKVARVDAAGRVFPLANGTAEITATVEGKTVKVPLTAEQMDAPLPINFANQVEPDLHQARLLRRAGATGRSPGQNGFRLSLLGFDPAFDYDNLLKETRGRRVFPAAPEKSLLLTKATGAVPHGGGKKMDPAGEEYKIVRRWVASGHALRPPDRPDRDEDQRLPGRPRRGPPEPAAARGVRPLHRRHG